MIYHVVFYDHRMRRHVEGRGEEGRSGDRREECKTRATEGTLLPISQLLKGSRPVKMRHGSGPMLTNPERGQRVPRWERHILRLPVFLCIGHVTVILISAQEDKQRCYCQELALLFYYAECIHEGINRTVEVLVELCRY